MVFDPITLWQIDREAKEQWQILIICLFLDSQITVDGEIKRHLLLGREIMTNLDSILESRNITLPTKVCLVKAMVFPCSHVWMSELDYKESWVLKNWCFWTVVLEKTLESPWTARRYNQSILKEINSEYLSEGLMPWN